MTKLDTRIPSMKANRENRPEMKVQNLWLSANHVSQSRGSTGKDCSRLQIKGLIMEDGAGKEFVLVCDSSSKPMGTVFSLSGWQRRRLVPLHHTEREHQQIVTAVLLALNHLLENVPKFVG